MTEAEEEAYLVANSTQLPLGAHDWQVYARSVWWPSRLAIEVASTSLPPSPPSLPPAPPAFSYPELNFYGSTLPWQAYSGT
eukprot:5446735-Prymnesium_polylepis.2